MKKTILLCCFIIINIIFEKASSQDIEKYGKEGINVNLGFGFVGPILSIGSSYDGFYGELYYEHHLIDLEKNEDLINKGTSGGFQLGFNFIPNYLSEKRLKWLFGLGSGISEERAGKNTGFDYTGEVDYVYLNGGIRYFVKKSIFFQIWAGYPVSIDKSQSILTKFYPNEKTSKISIIPASVTLQILF